MWMRQETLEHWVYRNNKATMITTITRLWKELYQPRWTVYSTMSQRTWLHPRSKCSHRWAILVFRKIYITIMLMQLNQARKTDHRKRASSLPLTKSKGWWTRRTIGEWGPRLLTRCSMTSKIVLKPTLSTYWLSLRSWLTSSFSCWQTRISRSYSIPSIY